MNTLFKQRLHALQQQHETLLQRQNTPLEDTNGIVRRYTFPVVTNGHIPLEWRYDLNPATNPFCLERIGVNACMNSGAIKWNGKYLLMVRVEGWDRKSFFAIAESPNATLSCIQSLFMANMLCTPVRRMDLSQRAAVVA